MAYGSFTITDLNEAESWYMHIKYAPNGNPSDSQIKDSSTGMSYIGVYTGPSQTAPTTARSYTWTQFVGESVIKTVPIYYLKIDSTAVPTIADGTEIVSTSTASKTWTKAIPAYVNNGIYYTAVQVFTNGNVSPITTTIVQDQGLTDACKNSAEALSVATNVADDAAGALSIATGVRQHFWSLGSDYRVDSSFTLPAGSYATEKAIDSFKGDPTGGYLITRSDGVYLNKDRYTLMALTGSALKFYRPGTTTIDTQLTSNGLIITHGSITLGGSATNKSSVADGSIALSDSIFTREINDIPRTLQMAIGGKFGVGADGTLYASGAVLGGYATSTNVSDAMGGFTILWDSNAGNDYAGGEAKICKYDPLTGTISQAAGWAMWNGIKRTIPNVEFNPNTAIPYNIPIYLVLRLSSSTSTTGTVYPVWYNDGWKYSTTMSAPASSNIAAWTWVDATDMVLGKCVEPASEGVFTECETYNPPQNYKAISNGTITASGASKVATNYITNIDSNNGITIKAINGTTNTDATKGNYVKLNANGLYIYQGGIDYAHFGSTVRIGQDTKTRLSLTNTGLNLYDENNNLYYTSGIIRRTHQVTLISYEINADIDNLTGNITLSGKYSGNLGSNFKLLYNGVEPASQWYQWMADDTTLTVVCRPGMAGGTWADGDGLEFMVNYTTSNANDSQLIFGTIDSSGDYGPRSASFGNKSHGKGENSFALGTSTVAEGENSFASGRSTTANGESSHAEGASSIARGTGSHAEGGDTQANGNYSHAEGLSTDAWGAEAHAEGDHTKATKGTAHAEGTQTEASGDSSHAEGVSTDTYGQAAHAEGGYTTARGPYSHAEGEGSEANERGTHAGGTYTIAGYRHQTVIGKYNNNKSNTLFEIGNGSNTSSRANAFEVDTSGNVNIPSSARYQINGVSQPYIYRSTGNPSGGANGDVWLVYTN